MVEVELCSQCCEEPVALICEDCGEVYCEECATDMDGCCPCHQNMIPIGMKKGNKIQEQIKESVKEPKGETE